ncbi:MAG: aminopeptidase P family protein, partial [Acidimicrobiales bacterium]|nr:aminopeptidase P family protein [Acidimicrobiales bacterium]
ADPATFPPIQVAPRLGRLREALAGAGCDAVVVTTRANVRYLTGFTGSAGTLFVGPEDALLVTDGRYDTQAGEQVAEAGVDVRIEIGNLKAQSQALAKAGQAFGRVGLEAADVSWAAQRDFAAEVFPQAELVATMGLVEALRRVKDDGELARMRAAAAIADAALAEIRLLLAGGPTEAEVALALDHAMRQLGASGPSFETIVAAGPNGAKPHHRPGPRPIGRGELVVVDFGAVVDGYCSDCTRTFCVGDPGTDELARVVEVVAASQRAGVAAVSAGVEAGSVDQACRDLIAEAGWAEAFVHGTGHGVGLDIHEWPRVGPGVTDTLPEGSVVTVEPGVYLPGVGGARIEDTVVVHSGGCRALTEAPKELSVI